MNERKRHHIGLLHDVVDEPPLCAVTLPDYYPLTPYEVGGLLLAAQGTSDVFELWSIGMRLCQGIWGHTSSITLGGPLDYAVKRLLAFYHEHVQDGPAPGHVEEVCRWMRYTFLVEQYTLKTYCLPPSFESFKAAQPEE